MTLRTRMALLIGAAVAVAVALVATSAYFSAQRELIDEVDAFLDSRAIEAEGIGRGRFESGLAFSRFTPLASPDVLAQLIVNEGEQLLAFEGQPLLPVEDIDLQIAMGGRRAVHRTVVVDEVSFRLLTTPVGRDGALQLGRDLTETHQVLAGIRTRLTLIGALGVVIAAAIGWLVTNRAMVPVGRLTAAAEHVAATRDFNMPIEVDRADEVGRLARSFNTMLAALAQSRDQQQRLVMDASHELRTPLTSLRTNIEVLAKNDQLDVADREALLGDVTFELGELTDLVGELVDLATDAELAEQSLRSIDLGGLVQRVAERTERRSGRRITVEADDSEVTGRPIMLERAVGNLLSNADKWSPSDEPITVTVQNRRVTVADRGPGIDDGDKPFVLHRFYRADSARTMPGSGLGLSIVKQIVDAHGGTVFVEDREGGGALVGFDLG